MKTTGKETPKLKGLFIAMLVVISVLTAKSQTCNYNIHNTLDCDVVVSVSFSEYNPNCVTCLGGSQSISIPANSTYVITCADIAGIWGCSNPLCDISVKMTSPITAPACTLNTGTPLTGLPAGCNAGPGASMDVSASDTNINR